MRIEKAKRNQVKIKLGIQGVSGSGKTMGSLLIAYGLVGDWNKIAIIDTENHSASLYAHLGPFSVINLSAPFNPEKYIEAIRLCESAQFEVIVIDSISHEWEGAGGILEIHSNMIGNSFTNWGKLTPRHNAFIQAILQSSAHIIGTIRSKQEYVLNERNGKQVPEKVGLKGITREGMDYELTILFDLDIKHFASASKDRTAMFMDKPEFRLSPDIGRQILKWCQQGQEQFSFTDRINDCVSISELLSLYNEFPQLQEAFKEKFKQRKMLLTGLHTQSK